MKCLKLPRKNLKTNSPAKENTQKHLKLTFKMKKQRDQQNGVKKINKNNIKIVKLSKIANFNKKNSTEVLIRRARIFQSHKQNQ